MCSGLFCSSVSFTASCVMDLRSFPHDRQTCHLKFGSCKYRTLSIIILAIQWNLPMERILVREKGKTTICRLREAIQRKELLVSVGESVTWVWKFGRLKIVVCGMREAMQGKGFLVRLIVRDVWTPLYHDSKKNVFVLKSKEKYMYT